MNDQAIKQLTETVERFDTGKLISALNDFIISSYALPSTTKSKRKGKRADFSCEIVEKEIAATLSRSALILSHMSTLTFGANGAGSENQEQNTLYWLKTIKKHQMTLLMDISDEIEIIGNVIRQSGQMKHLLLSHSGVLRKAACLTDILHGRIINRPTAVFKVNGDDEDADRLNETIRKMRDYEDTFGPVFERDMANNDPEKTMMTIQELISESCGEIEKRKKRVVSGMTELSQSWKLFKKLATKGYSRLMRKKLGATEARHHLRITVFREQVHKNRNADVRVH